MITMIIFSKDRPCQLELLLRSIKIHYEIAHDINILYKFTNSEYEKGYNNLKSFFKDYNWIIEDNFKRNVDRLIQFSKQPYLCFFTDDDVVIKQIIMDELWQIFDHNDDIYTIALRMGKNVTRNYVNNIESPPPAYNSGGYIKWKWKDHYKLCDWGYPMSIQGNIFRTADIKEYVPKLKYDCPNALEGSMYHSPLNKPYMLCYKDQKVLGLQINRVASTSTNKCSNIDIKYLNDKFLNGERIKLEPIEKLITNMPDTEMIPEFEKWE